MKIYFAIKYHADNRNRRLIENISELLSNNNHDSFCIAKDFEQWGKETFTPYELMRKSFAEIEKADLLLIEFSEKGVGLGIEAGYAYAKGRPIVVIFNSGEVSTTLAGVAEAVYHYENVAELGNIIRELKTVVNINRQNHSKGLE